ncbi:competence protein ComEC [Pseudodesulfovibrio cashew]|uniref:Competence protein ComEC n=1 Tax=Pseudodesulfovibrio cashew TaxID=2678688 RepID=A0A6I6JGW8_9BACT|nr:competence protein ComEC [Pseudodesulfovibrio cashew]QGY39612.1 competence protein ComEC [Pseudodesulfovibrio cashew]
MTVSWISDPVFWLFALPALAVSGLLAQMVLSLFSCCAAFTLRGRRVHLKWWMIPTTSACCALLWGVAALVAMLR